MDPEYQAIINRRRTQLLEDVTWSSKVIARVIDKGLVSRDEWRKIQLQKEDNHSYLLLAAIEKCSIAGAFAVFCQILEDTGNHSMTESLLFDKTRISWGFETTPPSASAAEYIGVLGDELWRPLLEERDPFRQQAMQETGHQRLVKLSDFLRSQAQRHERLLVDIFTAVDRKEECETILAGRKKGNQTLIGLEDGEEKMQRKLVHLMAECSRETEDHVTALTQLAGQMEEVGEERRQCSGLWTRDDDASELKDHIKKQDREINRLQSKISSAKRECHLVRKLEVERMLAMMQPYAVKNKPGDVKEEEGEDVGLLLHHNVKNLIEQMDRLKMRVRETSERVSNLEREKGSAKLALGVGLDAEELSSNIHSRVDDLNGTITSLEGDNRLQRDHIKHLKSENQTLKERNESLQQEIYNLVQVEHLCSTKPANPVKPRRGSLPVATRQTTMPVKPSPLRVMKARVSSASSSTSSSNGSSGSSNNRHEVTSGRKVVVPHHINLMARTRENVKPK